jgi:hypothetical protein
MSVGVKGLRIGTGPRGHYVQAGLGGFYYRASLRPAGSKTVAKPSNIVIQPRKNDFSATIDMIEVKSGDVEAMRDEAFSELLQEINAKQRQLSMAALLGGSVTALGFAASCVLGAEGLIMLLLALPAWAIGLRLDSYRRTTVLFYDLDASVTKTYENVVAKFDALQDCGGKWHIEAGGAVNDLTTWKRNAGANHLIRRKPMTLTYKLPAVIKSNITPPALHVGRHVVYFFPDVALIEDGVSVGAVAYSELMVRSQVSNFIEDDCVPQDAQVIYHTWKHPNKGGGPDRRFSVNYQIPVCYYEAMHLSSNSGVNILVQFSQVGTSEPFANALKKLPRQGAFRSVESTESKR